ncbi:MAG: hypothetical protein ACK43K_12650 [Chitinophagales bacterium]|jgi:hypothetical protein|nr:hypothetical protein [Sphingobacteriales bacterium]
MKYTLEIEVSDNQISFAEEFFKTIKFIKKFKLIPENQITKPSILKSMDDYENNRVKPTPLSLKELKEMIDA